ncbi:MAG: ribosome silencing factor [Tepidisphaeraceae bacterium]
MSTKTALAEPSVTTTKQQEEQARQFALDAARLAAMTRCHNVVILDVRQISPVTDFLILATGTSARQMRSVCDELAELAQQRGHRPLAFEGLEGDQSVEGGQPGQGEQGAWMLIDFVDVVFHVFSQEARAYYDLDSLWGDAKVIPYA